VAKGSWQAANGQSQAVAAQEQIPARIAAENDKPAKRISNA
jgi:hypothetical protein